jgi:hypothetical protein
MEMIVTCNSSVVNFYLMTGYLGAGNEVYNKAAYYNYTCGDRIRIQANKVAWIVLV